MKRTTPATKAAAKKIAPSKKTAAKKTAAKKSAAKKSPARKAAPRKTPAAIEKSLVSKTVVTALGNVGFGNTLYIRGSAPGLSWEYGVPMDCKSADSWSIAMVGVNEPFEYKTLVNDEIWCHGENYVAQPGAVNEISPQF